MDQLLDEVDSLPHPDLASLAGSWCESCETLRQEVKRLQDDQLQNFGKLKQKIISTDLLIKKYKTKCDDYDNQSKRLEETTRRLEKAQRQAETLELQLKSSLLETEPLRKSKYSLEVEMRTKNAEVEDALNKMVCAQGLQRQIQGENKYLQDQVDNLEAEKKDLKEKVHAYKLKEKDGESVKYLKAEVASLKREISGLKRENMKQVKKEQTLETKLQETLDKMNHYCNMLKQHKLLTAAKKSLPHHRSPGRSQATSDSDLSCDPAKDTSLLHKDIRKSIEESESSSDDDDHSVFQVPWAFSPMVKCLSPLPPSPACFAQKQASQEDDDDDEDDEYLSDLAEELENQLMDILSEDEITEVNNAETGNVIGQQNKNSNNSSGIAAAYKTDGSSFLENITKDVKSNADKAKNSNGAIYEDSSEKMDISEETSNGFQVGIDNDNDSLSVELVQAASASDSVCKDILDSIVNEILGDTVCDVDEIEETKDVNIEQTVYCDDTTLIKTPVRKNKPDLNSGTENQDNIESQVDTSDSETFKSPKSLKERLRDSSLIISPVHTKQRSAQKLSKSGSKASLCLKKSDSKIIDVNGKDSLANAQNDKCSENTSDQNANLNRSDTGEFTPALHEVESPSAVNKEKSCFFIPGQESSCAHSIKEISSSVNNSDSVNAKFTIDGNSENKSRDAYDNSGSPKPVLKRQMALRKDSASDIVEKKVCSEPDDASQKAVMANKRITRSKSMPNKYIKFQKGTCETLADEMVKFDVSKGGYEKSDKTEIDKVKECVVALEIMKNDSNMETNSSVASQEKQAVQKKAKQTDTSVVKQTDMLTAKQTDTPIAKQNETPIAKRTRRSSRLQSLPETNTEMVCESQSTPSKIMPNKDEIKNIGNTEKEKMANNTFDNGKGLAVQESNVEKSDNDSSLTEDVKVSDQQLRKTETEDSSLRTEKNIENSSLDFKGDSIKSVSETISQNPSSEINVDSKGEIQNSSPSIGNIEDTVLKTTPSRQLSTGFLLHNQGSDKQKERVSPVRLKETIIEETENVTDNTDSVEVEEAPVIFHVNDIFNDSVTEDTIVQQTDKGTKTDFCKDDKSGAENTSVGESLTANVHEEDNTANRMEQLSENTADRMEQLSEDISSPVASPFDLFQSDNQSVSAVTKESNSESSSPASWLEPGTSGNKSIGSQSGSVTPDNFSESDMPVLSPLPMSLFEMVDLISPLPPTPTPMDEPLSPLSGDEDADKTITEDDALKSPEANDEAMLDITMFNTPESKPPVKLDKLNFTPLPAMLSPIVTPKRLKSAESSIQKDTQVSDGAQKPCHFINHVPTGISIKPKPVHASELNESVSQELNADVNSMEIELSKDDTSPSHKENLAPNTSTQQCAKNKILKSVQSNTKDNGDEITKIGANKRVSEAVIVLDKLVMSQDKDKADTIQSKSSEIKKTPGDSDKIETETKLSNTVPEVAGGYDNLVASKTKKRQAHQNKIPRLPVKKPIPIIEAPVLLPVNRKRKSTETAKEKDKDKIEEKKPCKEHVFKRRQKNESKAKTAVSKLMQNFLKSDDPPETLLAKFETEQGETEEETPEERALNTCFDCLSRIRNDTLEAVYNSCTTEDYLNVIDDWPYLCNVEKQAVDLCWHITHGAKQAIPRAAIMKELWDRIFSNEQGTSISGKKSLTRLFTAMCFKAGNVEEVRVLYYHIVACGYMNSLSFLVPVISVWPETFRRESDEDHGMIIVMEYILMQILKSQDNATNKQIQECAMKLCNWSEEGGKADTIVAKLLKKLENTTDLGKAFEIRKSIELLIMKEGCEWFYKNFVNPHLQRTSNKYQSKGNKCGLTTLYICNMLRIAGTFLAQFNEKQKLFNDSIRNWILPILRKEPSCDEVRECSVEVLLEVACFNPRILNNLQGWYYHFKGNVRPDLEYRMEVLRTEFNSKFTTVIHPFVKKYKPLENRERLQ